MSLLQSLKTPYPCGEPASRLRTALAVGVFIGLFLLVFRPFGLANLQMPFKTLFILGYGGVTFVVFAAVAWLFPRLVPAWYREERWTAGKQVAEILCIVFLIGLGNLAYTSLLPGMAPTPGRAAWFQGITLAVAAFPVTALILLNQLRLAHRYRREAERLYAGLAGKPVPERGRMIRLTDETGRETVELPEDRLLFLESADNYTQIHFREGRETKQKMLRTSLKRMEEQLSAVPGLARCHRAFIVNLGLVKGVSGNAQGYRLRLDGLDRTVPVSRGYGRQILEKLR